MRKIKSISSFTC